MICYNIILNIYVKYGELAASRMPSAFRTDDMEFDALPVTTKPMGFQVFQCPHMFTYVQLGSM